MIYNPELRRNIWLDFTLHRVILTPLIIGILIYLSHLTGGAASRANTSFNLACFFIYLWGIKKASETVIEELNGNTWDFQRQSAISPFAMTFGKLIGSTLFSWYGATICLVVYATSYTSTPNNLPLWQDIFILVTGGILGQAVALLASLQIIPQIRRDHVHKTFRYFLLGFFVSSFAAWATFIASTFNQHQVEWFNFTFSQNYFAQTSLLLFTIWAIIGLQRSFSSELQYQNIPYAWVGFNLFCMIYFSGLSSSFANYFPFPQSSTQEEWQITQDVRNLLEKAPYYVAFFVGQTLTYIALFSEVLSTVRYKKIILRLNEENPLEAAEQIPLWSISFIFMLAAGILSIFALSVVSERMSESFSPTILLITASLFTMRDVLLIHYFNFSANIQRVLGASVIYLFLLYMLIPSLLIALHLTHLNVMFLPSWGQSTLLALVSIFIQIAIVAYLCLKHWQMNWGQLKN